MVVVVMTTTVFQDKYPDDPVWSRLTSSSGLTLIPLPLDLTGAQQVLDESVVDVLVLCDVGMDSLTSYLSHARLAPLQLAFWGHPLTTGKYY